ncbi:uncharacterized protein LOC133930092 [Phragmites australis]|uniref:uncharacterized protein LOC133930092 n=1 Tax=Phragmites australis TaxID=29695 RepID=UPI002D7859FA|nr:uncharacterized protein LOC133930092 [Phragmites australis]
MSTMDAPVDFSTALDAMASAAAAAARAAVLSSDATNASTTALADAVAKATAEAVRAVLTSFVAPASSSSAPLPQRNSSVNLDDDTTASLHAQAVAVLNVKTLVPVTLDLAAANYTKWRGLFLVILGKYALADHVLSDDSHPDRPDWVRMDCVILAWLYSSISVELLEIVMSSSSTAHIVWRGLEHQFLGNCEQRTLNLSAEFHCFVQGDLSVTDFCQRLKSMADGLADLGEPVSDRTLVLTMLKGLNDKFRHLQTILPMQKPFPTFVEARSQLLLEEITRGGRSTGAPTAFLAAGSGAGRGSLPGGVTTSSAAHVPDFGTNSGGNFGASNVAPNGGNGGHNNKNNHRRRGGQNNSAAPFTQQQQPWASPHNPWAGTIQMWPGPLGRGLLGARPAGPLGQPGQAAPFTGAALAGPFGAMGHPGLPAAPQALPPAGLSIGAAPTQPPPLQTSTLSFWNGSNSTPPAHVWDQQALANAFSTVSLQQPASPAHD